MIKYGKIITFEGIDQSGKETQSKLVRERLEAEGHKVGYTYFPNYETHIGKEIAAFLAGDRPYSPNVTQLLYAANRYEILEHLKTLLAENDFVIIDRYVSSGVVYGCVNGLDFEWANMIESKLPQEDITVLLDISSEVSRSRKSEDTRDIYEKEYSFLDKVRQEYLTLGHKDNWIIVDANDNVENIHEIIWSKLKSCIDG